jgi:hypothetical protein
VLIVSAASLSKGNGRRKPASPARNRNRNRAPFCAIATCSGTGCKKFPSPDIDTGLTNHSHSARGISGDSHPMLA